MAKLKQLDDVAYVRFASVYRQFKDINTLWEELHKLLEEKTQQGKNTGLALSILACNFSLFYM